MRLGRVLGAGVADRGWVVWRRLEARRHVADGVVVVVVAIVMVFSSSSTSESDEELSLYEAIWRLLDRTGRAGVSTAVALAGG